MNFGTAYQENDSLWTLEYGRPYDPDYLYHSFKKLIKEYNDTIFKDEELTDEEKEAKLLHDMQNEIATAMDNLFSNNKTPR